MGPELFALAKGSYLHYRAESIWSVLGAYITVSGVQDEEHFLIALQLTSASSDPNIVDNSWRNGDFLMFYRALKQ